eukprot:317861-Pyramimonas_sp.AAC.1
MEGHPDADAAPKRRRPNRSAAARRAQYLRAEARVTAHLLRALDALSEHRGVQPSRLAGALAAALRPHAAAPAEVHHAAGPWAAGADPWSLPPLEGKDNYKGKGKGKDWIDGGVVVDCRACVRMR